MFPFEQTHEIIKFHPDPCRDLAYGKFGLFGQKLRAREGRTVKLSTRVEPDLLGGLIVTIGSKRIDSSIRSRLNSLAQAMKG